MGLCIRLRALGQSYHDTINVFYNYKDTRFFYARYAPSLEEKRHSEALIIAPPNPGAEKAHYTLLYMV